MKEFLIRQQQAHDTQSNWEKTSGFIPLAGEIITYDRDENFSYSRIKLGDGITDINQLPFLIVDSQTNSVTAYGAKGDGVTDDTEAFKKALAIADTTPLSKREYKVITVPGGIFKLSETIVIPENFCLVLQQNTQLNFTLTSGNCIEMRGSATLEGHHAIIRVYKNFTGNVISIDTSKDGVIHASIPPYAKADPMWKRARYITDINIVKTDPSTGFNSSIDGTDIGGIGLFISANFNTKEDYDGVNTAPIAFIWGMTCTGIRISGAFECGIKIINTDQQGGSTNPAWNHELRIEAIVVACKTGLYIYNCNTAHLAVAVQPSLPIYKVNNVYVKYAKNGIVLVDSHSIDLSQSIVWDWNEDNTLISESAENAHIALYGDCRGLILSDFTYYEVSKDIYERIYTDNTSNFDKMNILQEPITKWFKPVKETVDSVTLVNPYFFDGANTIRLASYSDLDRIVTSEGVFPDFENILPQATDGKGNIYGEKGYKTSVRIALGSGAEDLGSSITPNGYGEYYLSTGFLPIKVGESLYLKNLFYTKASNESGVSGFLFYDSSFNPVYSGSYTLAASFNKIGTYSFEEESTQLKTDYYELNKLTIPLSLSNNAAWSKVAYVRFTLSRISNPSPDTLLVSKTPITYSIKGQLADQVFVKLSQIYDFKSSSLINETSSDSEYPTAKAVYNFFNESLGLIENGKY